MNYNYSFLFLQETIFHNKRFKSLRKNKYIYLLDSYTLKKNVSKIIFYF